MSSWIDCDPSILKADYPLCSGQTIDWMYENLVVVQSQSFYGITTCPVDVSSISFTFTNTNKWELLSTVPPIYLPMRKNTNNEVRGISIGASGKISVSSATFSLRYYARALVSWGQQPDETNGFEWEDLYCDLEYSSTAWDYDEDTIDDPDFSILPDKPANSGYGGSKNMYPTLIMMPIGKCTASSSIYLDGFRFREILS